MTWNVAPQADHRFRRLFGCQKGWPDLHIRNQSVTQRTEPDFPEKPACCVSVWKCTPLLIERLLIWQVSFSMYILGRMLLPGTNENLLSRRGKCNNRRTSCNRHNRCFSRTTRGATNQRRYNRHTRRIWTLSA